MKLKKRKTFNIAGHAHELTFSCYRRLPLLEPDDVKLSFIECLKRAKEKHDFEIWAYVIMQNHVHLLLYPKQEKYNISDILNDIKKPNAEIVLAFYRKNKPELLHSLQVSRPHGRTEHRFWQQGGGYDRNLFSKEVITASIEYIHGNPVRSGLVEDTTSWRWSSARWYAGFAEVDLEMDFLTRYSIWFLVVGHGEVFCVENKRLSLLVECT